MKSQATHRLKVLRATARTQLDLEIALSVVLWRLQRASLKKQYGTHTFSSLSCSSAKNQLHYKNDMERKTYLSWRRVWVVCTCVCVCVLRCSYMMDERLYYLVAVGHVRDHIFHVVFRCPNQSRAEHQSQVPGLHLHVKIHYEQIYPSDARLCSHFIHRPSFTHLVFIWGVGDSLQVNNQELQSVVVVIWKVSDLWNKNQKNYNIDKPVEAARRLPPHTHKHTHTRHKYVPVSSWSSVGLMYYPSGWRRWSRCICLSRYKFSQNHLYWPCKDFPLLSRYMHRKGKKKGQQSRITM